MSSTSSPINKIIKMRLQLFLHRRKFEEISFLACLNDPFHIRFYETVASANNNITMKHTPSLLVISLNDFACSENKNSRIKTYVCPKICMLPCKLHDQ